MKTIVSSVSGFLGRRLISCLLVAAVGLSFAASARAQATTDDPAMVIYDQDIVQLQGIIPFSRTYSFQLTAPTSVPAGNTAPIAFAVSSVSIPPGVSEATAVSYVSISPKNPVFSGPGQSQTITVTYTIPANAVPGGYGMKILATGFPATSGGIVNNGTFINAAVTASAVNYTPPDVAIANPTDGSTITIAAGSLPVTVPFSFVATSTGEQASPISQLTAMLDMTTVALSTTSGVGTTSASGSGNLVVSSLGTHSVTVQATNLGGVAADVNQFTIVVAAANPPTVVINSPVANSVYIYRTGTATPTVVPFTFTATSSLGGIDTLTAKVDGANMVFSPVGIGTLTATGTILLPYNTAGTHTVSVTTTDRNGTATANSNFTINVVSPTPTIAISQPLPGATIAVPVGSTTVSVPYTFVTTSNNGFVVDSVQASLDGNSVTIGSTSGLGTATATSTGTLVGVTPGTHTLVATGVSAGITVSTSTTFTVTSVQPPPTVVINTPPAGSTYTRTSTGAALSIPLTFTGTSNATNGVITQLKASLNGTALTVTPTNLNQKIATGSATMTVSAAGTYTIGVTAIDAVGTASATRTFSVVVVQPRTICGTVFFDLDGDGVYDCQDFDISGVTVKLYDSNNALLGTDVSDCGGDYSFGNLGPGTYRVVATAYAGLKASTTNERTVTIAGSNVCVPRIGFCLDFAALRPMKANGFTIGYWKNNIDKAIAGSSNGVQVSKSTLTSYTSKIGCFAFSPYDCISMKTASSTMGYSGSTPSSLLSKQLIASEYNYQNAAYIGGNKTLTMAFLWWGEYVLANPSKYSSTYIIWAKDWFDAYNNTHGGAMNGPL